MTTIINTPTPAADSGGSNFLIGAVVLIVFIALLLYFGIPAIRNIGTPQVNVAAPQIVVPDKINVNVTPAK